MMAALAAEQQRVPGSRPTRIPRAIDTGKTDNPIDLGPHTRSLTHLLLHLGHALGADRGQLGIVHDGGDFRVLPIFLSVIQCLLLASVALFVVPRTGLNHPLGAVRYVADHPTLAGSADNVA